MKFDMSSQRQQLMLSAGMLACEIETSKVAAIFFISYKAVQYWKKQVLEKKIPNEHGGARYEKFSQAEMLVIEYFVQQYVKDCLHIVNRTELVEYVRNKGFKVTAYFISKIFKKFVYLFLELMLTDGNGHSKNQYE